MYELEGGDGSRALYTLPSRLRHVVFIRPRSHVLALPDPARAARGKVVGDIDAVVLDAHLAELRRHPLWPPRFAEGGKAGGDRDDVGCGADEDVGAGDVALRAEGGGDADGDYASSEESELEGNPNRRRADMFHDSDGEE